MTVQITHPFVSAKGDGTDATLVRPSNWNAAHVTSMAPNSILGNNTVGTAPFAEIPISPFMAALLATTDLPTLQSFIGAATTGDMRWTFATVANPGWLMVIGSPLVIGDATSGAALRANADCANLFALIWNGCPAAAVSGGRGANPAADFAAHKTIVIPDLCGRSVMAAGLGTGLTNRVLGTAYGEENHFLTTPELAPHAHGNTIIDPGHVHSVSGGVFGGTSTTSFTPPGFSAPFGAAAIVINSNVTGVTINNVSAGGGLAHNTIHPVLALNLMIRL